MMTQFFPTEIIRDVYTINYEQLYANGIRGLIFDIDNTLVPYFIKDTDEKLLELFTKLKEKGFQISLVSNGKKDRVLRFNSTLKLYAIHRAAKPRTKNLKKAMEVMGTTKDSTVMIGDQVFTDVWAGNRLGVYTILVDPISEKDEFVTWIKRGLEKKILNAHAKRKKRS